MGGSKKHGARADRTGLETALKAFQKADSGKISPGELAGALRGVLSEADSSSDPVWGELRDFVALDLSDYAYSLAIHDQAAIDELKERISGWAARLEKESGPGK